MTKEVESLNNKLVRVALYIRVSGEEQKMHGLSLDAQQERLELFARERGWVVVGTYIDAAKTARKNMHKRTEFLRMMQDVKQDKIDILLFCRLDRWFRSVADYYKIMEVLEKHNCHWKAIDEDYDTSTANGRLYINIKLSIAQNEADIDGERIDVVFDSKITKGTVVSGSCPFGYRVNKEKRLEIVPEKASIVQDAFNFYETNVTKRGTIAYIRKTYSVNWCEATFRRMLVEELYIGVYNRGNRHNDNFCPPIINKDQFLRVQELLKRNARAVPSGRVYIFTSIIICSECSHKMIAYKSRDYYYYRCNQHFQRGRCHHNRAIRESVIEEWLFLHLAEELEKYKSAWDLKTAEKKRAISATDKATLKAKLTRLKELYVNNLIDIEDYKKDYEIYSASLQNIPEEEILAKPNFKAIENVLASDFKKIYDDLPREEKRTLWRSIIKEIHVDNESNITNIFFG